MAGSRAHNYSARRDVPPLRPSLLIIHIYGLQTILGVHSRGLSSPGCPECLYLGVAQDAIRF